MPTYLWQWANGVFRVDPDLIYAPLLRRLLKAQAAALARGAGYYAIEGLRSYARSAELELASLAGGPRAAGPGKSAHNFGLAVDFAYDSNGIPGLQPRWKAGDFDILGEEVERVGLKWGGRFNDSPHVGWPGFENAKELVPLADLWTECVGLKVPDRLRVCWSYVDSYGPTLPEE